MQYKKFLIELQKTIPQFNIKFKNESFFMRFLGFILFFNKSFMTNYITTIGNTVYFPSEKIMIQRGTENTITIVAHEFVHALDNKDNKLFKFLYLFPQILSPIFFILIFLSPLILSLVFSFLAILCILPIIPAYWRSKYEVRAYEMSLFMRSEILRSKILPAGEYDKNLMSFIESINNEFIGPSYYWMNRTGVKQELINTFTKIKTDDIVKDDPSYLIVRAAFINSK